MKLSVFTASSVLLASASAGSFFHQAPGFHETVGRTALGAGRVPGDNPFDYCGDTAEHILNITKVDLIPNPLVAGEPLNIKASGKVMATINTGAKVKITVYYGMIRIIDQDFDICENLDQVDMKCPIEKGEITVTKGVDIPKQIPPGRYTVFANATNADECPITCMTAIVSF